MSKAAAQTVSPRSSTPSLPTPFPYSTKDDTKKWLDHISSLQGLPQTFYDKAASLGKRLMSTKGKLGDELKTELETLFNELLQLQVPQQQVVQVAQVLRDVRVDALVQKMNELEIAEQLKAEITTDMENTKMRLKSDIVDNYDKIKQLKSDLAERDDTINDLRNKLKELTKEKEALEKKIKMLETEIDELKQNVGKLQITVVEKDKKIEKLMQMHADRIEKVTEESQDMRNRIKDLESRNEELAKMNESRIVVGETMKITVKAIYKHVHPKLPLRKRNFYAVHEISDHLSQKYFNDPNEKMAAERRWDKLKDDLGWDEETEDIIQELINKRNQTAHPLKPPVDKIKFRDALRQMKEENDIEDEEENVAYDIYTQCQRKFKI